MVPRKAEIVIALPASCGNVAHGASPLHAPQSGNLLASQHFPSSVWRRNILCAFLEWIASEDPTQGAATVTMFRYVSVASMSALLAAAACGGGSGAGPTGPGAPASTPGAIIAGTVRMAGGGATSGDAMDGAPAAGVTVTVEGTTLSTTSNAWGYFRLQNAPAGTVRVNFRQGSVNATAQLANVQPQELVEIQVEVGGATAVVVSDARATSSVSLCHATGNGSYHSITVSTDAEPAHRAHGDAKVGEKVPAEPAKTFDESCKVVGPSIEIEKFTNGEDADEAPGPTIIVGAPITWEYRVTNTGTIPLTNVVVVDDRNVAVTCPSTTLAAAQSMTCTGSGVATLGQYRNVGTVTANWTGGTVTDADASHYFGEPPDTSEGQKVELCHRTGNGSYHLISVAISAEPAHRAHGDGKIGESVPGQSGKVFGAGCSVR